MTSVADPPGYDASYDLQLETRRFKPFRIPDGVRPSNFVRANRPTGLKEIWIIDPTMKMPINVYPGSSTSSNWSTLPEERKNLEITTTAPRSEIFADVFVLPAFITPTSPVLTIPNGGHSIRTLISLESAGKLTLRLHDASPEVKTENRLPIVVSATSKDGSMRVNLPKSFCGPLHMQTMKRVWYSAAVKAQITPLSEVNGNYVVFIGYFDVDRWNGWDSWQGDSFSGDAGQNAIDIYFDDEDHIPTKDSNCICM